MSQAQLMSGDGKERRENDNYPTPKWAVRDLIQYSKRDSILSNLPHVFLEPACGKGNIVSVLEEYGYTGIVSDIEDYGQGRKMDFLKDTHYTDSEFKREFSGFIITNIPFSLTVSFIHQAKSFPKVNTIIFLMKQAALSGIDRYEQIWKDKEFPLYKILQIKKRLKFDGYKHVSPLEHCWFIWNRFYTGNPIIDWV